MIDFNKFDSVKLFKSKLTIVSVASLGAIIVVTLVIYIFKSPSESSSEPIEQSKEILIKPTAEVIITDELWRGAMSDSLNKQNQEVANRIDAIQKELLEVEQKTQENTNIHDLEEKIIALTAEINSLRNHNSNLAVKELPPERNRNISQYTLNLDNSQNSKEYKPRKTAENYIPAGSFAKAVLLSGVDAHTSLSAIADPDPVLIRIVDHGNLPRRFKSDLKDCHVIAAAYGDLSSERAKIRLEKLSCTEIATGEIIETEVAGFITGEDGRQGIRGEVVSTEGKLLGHSMLSGVLSGLANNFNSNTASKPTAIMTSDFANPSTKDRLQDSFSSGASSSLDRLSKYYIERAESLQPIVQVGAGRKVDVIFTEGVFFGTTAVKKALAKKRDNSIQEKSEEIRSGFVKEINR